MFGVKVFQRLLTTASESSGAGSFFVHNRNPRNLEKLCIAKKPQGWHLEQPGQSYWHKLTLERSAKHLTAILRHYKGLIAVTASTKEWPIRKYLYSTIDKSAHINLARVMALRCIQSGITEMIPGNNLDSENLKAFFSQLEQDGLTLKEPDNYVNPRPSDTVRPEKPWETLE